MIVQLIVAAVLLLLFWFLLTDSDQPAEEGATRAERQPTPSARRTAQLPQGATEQPTL